MAATIPGHEHFGNGHQLSRRAEKSPGKLNPLPQRGGYEY